jgi:predicted Zn finger-like uncharacterized protein
MIVQCPNCATKFKFPDDKIKPGVKVRCSKCKNIFELNLDAQAQQAAQPAAPEPTPPPPPQPPAPAPSAPPKHADDKFNFGDDIDFSTEQPPAPEPKASTERKPMTPNQKDYAVGFDDIQVGEEKASPPPPPRREPPPPPRREPEPPPQKAPSEESEEFSFEDEADFSTEEFGSRPKAEKDMDLGFSAEMPEIPGGDKKAAKSEEPDFEAGMADFKIDRGEEPAPKPAPKKGTDRSSTEDFDFGGKLESYARTDTIKTKGDSSDDLEANLDLDAESPPPNAGAAASAQVREEKPAPSRPVPMVRPAPKGGNLKYVIILAAALVAVLGGALLFFNSKGSFTFSDLGKGNFSKLKTVPQIEKILVAVGLVKPEIKGSVDIIKESLSVYNVQRNEGGVILVVQGKVRNSYPASIRFAQVQVDLYDAAKAVLASGISYCDVNFTKTELASMSESEIQGYMETKAGKNMNNLEIKPGEEREFTVVFFKPPKVVESYDPKVLNSYELIK